MKNGTDRFEHTLDEIYDVSDMLQSKGEYDGKCRYLEIMAKELLFISASLSLLRTILYVGFGVIIGHLLSQLF